MQKQKINVIKRIVILIVLLIALILAIWTAMARYSSSAEGVAEVEIAIYVLEENYQSMNINLGKMVPRPEAYVHTFSIANYNDVNRAEVDLEYTIQLNTTTNIPLEYELYLNENYDANGAENIIVTDTTESDDDGTYFRKMKTDSRTFLFTEDELDMYQLVVYFPSIYKEEEYQDMIESVEIVVESKQII